MGGVSPTGRIRDGETPPISGAAAGAYLLALRARLAIEAPSSPDRVTSPGKANQAGSARASLRLLVGLAGSARDLRALVLVEDDLADAHLLRRDLDALVVAAELEALLQRQPLRRDELLEVVRRRGPDVGLLLLAGDVDVH